MKNYFLFFLLFLSFFCHSEENELFRKKYKNKLTIKYYYA